MERSIFILFPIIRPPFNGYFGPYFARPVAIIAGDAFRVIVSVRFDGCPFAIADGAAVVPELHPFMYLFILRWGHFDDMFLYTHILITV